MKWHRINESADTSAMGTVIGLGKSLGNSDLKMESSDDESFSVEVSDGNDEWTITLTKVDGKWVETSDDAPRDWRPSGYQGYLNKDDIIDWLSQDFDSVHEIDFHDSDEYDGYEDVDELSAASIKEYFNWNLGDDMHTQLSSLPGMLEDKWDGTGGFDKAKTKIISLEDDEIDFVVKGSNGKFFDVAISNPFDIFVDEISRSEYVKMVKI